MNHPLIFLVWVTLVISFLGSGLAGITLMITPARYPENSYTDCYKYACWAWIYTGLAMGAAIAIDPDAVLEAGALIVFGLLTIATAKWRNRELPT